MFVQNLLGQIHVGNLFPHDLVLGDEFLLRLAKKNFMTKLHRLVSLDQLRRSFEYAENPLFRGNGFAMYPDPFRHFENHQNASQVFCDFLSDILQQPILAPVQNVSVLRRNFRYFIDLLDQHGLIFLYFPLAFLVFAPRIPGDEQEQLFDPLFVKTIWNHSGKTVAGLIEQPVENAKTVP